MELSNIVSELIGQTAFPIVAFILMYKMCNENISKVTEAINLLNASIATLTSKLNHQDIRGD